MASKTYFVLVNDEGKYYYGPHFVSGAWGCLIWEHKRDCQDFQKKFLPDTIIKRVTISCPQVKEI
jgi:hypothetical protein